MLDHRVYRAAFLPALVALFIVAFSLGDPPKADTTALAPLAFQANRAYGVADPPPRNSLRELAASFPDRRAGGLPDGRLADRIAGYFETVGFAGKSDIARVRTSAETVDGAADLEAVVARRQGLSNRAIVVIAHRDARRGPAEAELSGTAALMELGRLFADRDLSKTIVLASVSGGSGGYAGARAVAESLDVPVDAVFVLGNLAGDSPRRPFVVPFSSSGAPAPYTLERTAQVAVRKELATNPGRVRATVQLIRRAFPMTLSEQGVVDGAGLPAVLISASGERRPAPDEKIRPATFGGFGRATLRMISAMLEAPDRVPPSAGGIVTVKRLVPDWAIRLLVGALLLPALVTAFDAFFRVRRRGLPMGAWTIWSLSFVIPFALAWGWARLLDLSGAIVALPAPVAEGAIPLKAAGWLSMISVMVIFAGAAYGLRPLVLDRLGARGDASAGAAAAATSLLLCGLVALLVVLNPYAAAVLLPAAHVWLLASAPERSLGRLGNAAAWLSGLVLPLLIVLYYAQAWGLGPVEGLWTAFGILAGGALPFPTMVALCAFGALALASGAVLRARRRVSSSAPDETLRTRGPRSYAGPGSLGGTESALRR